MALTTPYLKLVFDAEEYLFPVVDEDDQTTVTIDEALEFLVEKEVITFHAYNNMVEKFLRAVEGEEIPLTRVNSNSSELELYYFSMPIGTHVNWEILLSIEQLPIILVEKGFIRE